MARKWVRSGALTFGLALVAVGVWAGANWNGLQTKYAVHRLKSAATEDERTNWAESLATRGDEGPNQLAGLLKAVEPPVRISAANALRSHRQYGETTMVRTAVRRAVHFLKREDGPTAVEYAVMLALIVVVCVAAITTIGANTNSVYSNDVLKSGLKPS